LVFVNEDSVGLARDFSGSGVMVVGSHCVPPARADWVVDFRDAASAGLVARKLAGAGAGVPAQPLQRTTAAAAKMTDRVFML
jgi:hypothetical protein